LGTMLIPGSGTTSDGADVGVFPHTHFYFGKTVNPARGFFAYRDTEILALTTQSVTVNAVAHSYFCLGSALTPTTFFAASRNSNAIMMLFE